MKTLDKKTYALIKKRIREVTAEEKIRIEFPYDISDGATLYYFSSEGLGDDFFSFVQPMRTKNMWNLCQHFYSLLRACADNETEFINLL